MGRDLTTPQSHTGPCVKVARGLCMQPLCSSRILRGVRSSGRGVRTVQLLDGDDGAGGVDPNEDEEVREGRERRGHRRELHEAGGGE